MRCHAYKTQLMQQAVQLTEQTVQSPAQNLFDECLLH